MANPFTVGIYGPSTVARVPPSTDVVIDPQLLTAYEQLFNATYTRMQAGDPLDSSIVNATLHVIAVKAS
jgi:hypothetical protein